MNDKPKTIREYKKWLQNHHAVDAGKQTRTYFETVADKVAKDFRESALWKECAEQQLLRNFDEQYKQSHDNYPLVISHDAPKLATKSFCSFLMKTFRKNIL